MGKYRFTGIITVLCIIALLNVSFINAQNVLRLDDRDKIVSLTPYIGFFKDHSRQLKIQDVLNPKNQERFQLNTNGKNNYGGSGGTLWFKMQIKGKKGLYILELTNSSLQEVDFYHPKMDGTFELIKKGIYQERPVKATSQLFKLRLNDEEIHTFYLRCQSEKVLLVPLNIGKPVAFIAKNHQKDLFHGMYFGIMLIMILYNLFIYLSTREVAYLYYVLYIISLTIMTAIMAGHSQEFLWPNHPHWDDYNFIPILFIGIFSVLFANRFLYTRRYAPRLRKISYILVIIYIPISLLGFVALNLALKLIQAMILLTTILMITMGVLVARKRYSPARLYLLGWGCILGAASFAALSYANVLPFNLDNIFVIELGATGEVLLFSLALADRINFYRKEKEQAQLEKEQLIQQQNEMLEKEVEIRTREIEQQKEEIWAQAQNLEESNKYLHQANTKIKSSIQYAKRIQMALLPMQEVLARKGLEFFILYKPRDIVSGDFYWFAEVEGHNQLIIVAADCTGHGVPGAFMTIMGANLLNQIVKENAMTSPTEILQDLDQRVMRALGVKPGKSKENKNKVQDGMDLSVCRIDFDSKQLIYAGAKRPLYYFHQHELKSMKGSKYPIGSAQYLKKDFEEHSIQFEKGDVLYLFSDGYADQFGGDSNTKFMIKHFKNLLKEIETLPMESQEKKLEQKLESWQGLEKQTDDILVLGLRF